MKIFSLSFIVFIVNELIATQALIRDDIITTPTPVKQLETNLTIADTTDKLYSSAYCILPKIESNGPVIEFVGNLAKLKCNVLQGHPKPEITWFRNKTKLVNSERYLISNNGTLEIIGTRLNDSGVYTCTANNNVHKPVSARITVSISKPSESYTFGPKMFTTNSDDVLKCISGKPCTIYCRAYGWPPPNIRWMNNYQTKLNNNDSGYDLTLKYAIIIRNFTQKILFLTCQASLSDDFNDNSPSRKFIILETSAEPDQSTILSRNNFTSNIPQQQCINAPVFNLSIDESTLKEMIAIAKDLENISQRNLIKAENLQEVSNLLYNVLNSSFSTVNNENNEDFIATNSILKNVHKILDNVDLGTTENGTAKYVTPYTAILVTDSNRSDVIGMMTLTSDPMTLSDVRPLYLGINDKKEVSANTVVRIKGNNLNTDLIHKLSFTVLANTRAFMQRNKSVAVVSHVVGVSTPDEEAAMLTSVEVELKPLTPDLRPGQTRECAYWDLEAGEWRTDDCKLLRHDETTGRDVCECQRLAHFGLILGVEGVSPILHNISLAGCILSIFGLLGIAITAAVFPKWRSQLGNKILLHLSLSIGLIMCTFLSIAFGATNGGSGSFGCIAVGVILHYSILAAFCWMLVTAILQFFRLVIIFASRPSRFLLKGAIFGWGLPLIPVITLLSIGPESYENNNNNIVFCYPKDLSLWLAVITPIAVIVIANLILFSMIMYKVTCGRGKSIKINANEATDKKLLIAQIKMSILLFFLLGLTWVFGLIAMITSNYQKLQIFFLNLFCILATLQGFIMFLYFIILDKKARRYWIHLIIKKLDKSEADSSIEVGNVTTVSSLVTFLRRLDDNNVSAVTETSTIPRARNK